MKPITPELEKCRISGIKGEAYGQFLIPGPCGFTLRVQVSIGQGWDHASVSLANRCPNWKEMDFIKRQFWNDCEVVMQLHVNGKSKVNVCETCLHLWRPQTHEESESERLHWVETGEPITEWHEAGPIPLPPHRVCVSMIYHPHRQPDSIHPSGLSPSASNRTGAGGLVILNYEDLPCSPLQPSRRTVRLPHRA